ncbi:GNAT family N-acetyltransferase [Cognatiluteimonas weifangensis]|uniref:N-acetyltransferase n=1 Tax=Cognatiluteimonas weifangensis TaxID=2303539 RepID=A0A372DNR5_9GAMM|nr:GNAT family N-acetyltransferase [Luteimonas weifangensis]RFP61218.1 N-acetyltransferase [Luteimonas weifangensis]
MPTVHTLDSLDQVPAAQWDALHDGRNPFVSHAFLCGLEQYGVLQARLGWTPRHLVLREGGRLLAAAPTYLKTNSHGEFVFDHAWARAYAQHGRDYFPKLLCAVPYTPVTGPRLLARDAAARRALLQALAGYARDHGLSSAHVNFHDESEDALFDAAWLPRIDVQYHWRNAAGWRDFDDFLAALDHKHRKNIRQERARVARAGVALRIVHGGDASDAELAGMHRFYLRTFAEYGNTPTLTLEFLRHLARALPRQLVLVLASRHGRDIAGALCLRGGDTLYGRYWGADDDAPGGARVPGLHFETCYYQGIDYCLREGLTRFEPGAQGEHKLARGFLPALVRSRHWIADPAFAAALAPWCAQEAREVRRYAAALTAHSPFRSGMEA